jgi:cilia- and flagella-associated protein 65
VIDISLQNSGVVPVDWIFQFLNDLEVDIEHWVDPGDYTEEQISQNFILDNNIFDISPRAGNLKPGDIVRIQLTYTHDVAGAHSLPVVFRLKNGASRAGKEVLINFTGYSVPAGQRFLHLQSNSHELQPIRIGTMVAPIQTYHLMNRGAVPLEFKIDTSTLEKVVYDLMVVEPRKSQL